MICTACSNNINIDCPECYGLGVKTAAPFNLTDQPTPCTTCANNPNVGMALKKCPSCGGDSIKKTTCRTCKGSGDCYGCDGTGAASNRANRNPTLDETLKYGRFTTAAADGTCGNTNGVQNNRESCGAPFKKGDVILTTSPEQAFNKGRRRGFKPTSHCPDCTIDTIRDMAAHEDATGVEHSQFGWSVNYDDDELENVLKTALKNKSGNLQGGHLREVAEGLAVPQKSVSGEGPAGSDEEQREFTGKTWKRVASLDEIIAEERVETIHKQIYAEGRSRHLSNEAWQASLDLETWLEITPRPSL